MNDRTLTDFISIDALEKWLAEIDLAIQKIPASGNAFASWQYALDQCWTLRQRVAWLKNNIPKADTDKSPQFHLIA